MRVVESIADCRRELSRLRQFGARVGFVPTMGALHAGHVSLMDYCRKEAGASVASIFVNPTQFSPTEDLSRYPRPREQDLALCDAAGVDLVFYPPVHEMYPSGAKTTVIVNGLSERWEGAVRPSHFAGVTTVVTKLFHIVQPDIAFFGQKDYQQQAILRQMVRDLNDPVVLRTCPTIREQDGLAMSSRNAYLSPEQRAQAVQISRSLFQAEEAWKRGERQPEILQELIRSTLAQQPALQIEYAAVADPFSLEPFTKAQEGAVALVACRLGATRLIDNLLLGSANELIAPLKSA